MTDETDDKYNSEQPEEASSDEESSDDDDDSLGLEGVLVRNPDASSSSDEDDDEDEEDDPEPKEHQQESDTHQKDGKRPASKTATSKKQKKQKKPKRSADNNEPDVINVTFTFCDMDEKYFHALKSLLHASSTVYQQHSSVLTDHMIDNVSVGTLISTQDDTEGNVYGFASVLNVTTYQSSPAIQFLKEQSLQHCPQDRRKELEVVLGGTTKRPAGFLLLGRMVNLPLEITLELYQQLVKDLDWAVEHAEGGPDERKSLDFGVFVRLAPCQQEGSSVVYRYFEDEIFAGRAEFVFTIDAPKAFSKEEKQLVNIMAMTKQGFRDAVTDIAKMVGGR